MKRSGSPSWLAPASSAVADSSNTTRGTRSSVLRLTREEMLTTRIAATNISAIHKPSGRSLMVTTIV
ncbi:MAG: hypothetical protein BWY91_02389 [bacterium ADurb.BinA028]|nr:MAG: hypothetical protein BWY91_02389 [bacterium ADurb.BinA028]